MAQFPYKENRGKFTGIPSAEQWKQLTSLYSLMGLYEHRRENPLLLAIDGSLNEFHAWDAAPFDERNESEESRLYHRRATALLLIDIAKKCQLWLESKASNDKSQRRTTIENLFSEAMVCINSLKLNLTIKSPGGYNRPDNHSTHLASLAASIRWMMLNNSIRKLGFSATSKVLHDDYWLENNEAVNPGHQQGGGVRHAWDDSQHKFAFGHVRAVARNNEVKYVSPLERWQFEVHVRNSGQGPRLFRRVSADSQELTLMERGGLFIIDKNRKLYCSMGVAYDGKLFHHSTMLAGFGVAFAGAISVEDGVLKDIDNASGHYRPELHHLLHALLILKMKGVPLQNVSLTFLEGLRVKEGMEELGPMPYFKIYNSAYRFLESGGECNPDRES